MNISRRHVLLAVTGLPLGCTIAPLKPLPVEPLADGGTDVAVRAPALGQQWVYRKYNFYNSALLDTVKEEIVSVGNDIRLQRTSATGTMLEPEVQGPWGALRSDPYWDYAQTYSKPVPLFGPSIADLEGKTFHWSYRIPNFSFEFWINVYVQQMRWERIRVAAGSFDALKISRLIRLNHPDHTRVSTTRYDSVWLAPEIGRWCLRETRGVYTTGRRGGWFNEDHFRWELERWSS